MRVKLLLFVIVLFLVSSCTYEQPGKAVTYVIDEQPKVFVIEEETPLSWLEETREKRFELNKIRALREYEEDLEEWEIKSRLSNVRRIIEGKLVIGYVKELDNPDFKEVK